MSPGLPNRLLPSGIKVTVEPRILSKVKREFHKRFHFKIVSVPYSRKSYRNLRFLTSSDRAGI